MATVQTTVYKNSALASIVSFLGTVAMIAGFSILAAGEVVAGIVCLLIAFALMAAGQAISSSKAKKAAEAKAAQEKADQDAARRRAMLQESEARAAREAQERAAREAQAKAAQQVQQTPQYTERDAQAAFDKYWNEVLWKHSVSEVSQDLNLMCDIFNNAPNLAKRKVAAKLREINYDLIGRAGWTCTCGHRNGFDEDCPQCGAKAFSYPF